MTWYSLCKSIVGKLLKKIGEESKIDDYFSKSNEPLWRKCFTHKSKDDENNYERVEFLGDVLLGFIFSLYIYKEYKGKFTEGENSELKRIYMSKLKQPSLARKLGISNLLIYNEELNDNMMNFDSILEDIYEAFFATLYEVSEIVKKNSGIVVTTKMLKYNFKDVEITREEGKGHSKNRVDQTFQTLASFSRPTDKLITKAKVDGEDVYVFKLSVPSKAKDILRDNNILLPDIIGEGVNKNKKDAKNIAYDNALKTLLEFGLDKDKAHEIKSLSLINKIDDYKARDEFTKKLNDEGYDYFQVEDQKLNNKDGDILYLFYLYGIKIGEEKVRLSFDFSNKAVTHEVMLLNLINKYI